MRAWRAMLGGLLVWTAHFFTLYILASVWGTSIEARIGTLVATLAALVAAVVLLRRARAARGGDPLADWMASIGMLAAALTIVAVLWQGLPALIG